MEIPSSCYHGFATQGHTHITKMAIKFLHNILQRLHRSRTDQVTEPDRSDENTGNTKSYLEDERRTYLDTASWFWGDLSKGQAEYLLLDAKEGTFVVRNSSTVGFLYCITYKLDGKVASLRIFEKDGQLSLNFDDPTQVRAATLHGLIAKLLNASIKYGSVCMLERSSKSLSLKLNSPVNRLSSLRAHCRRVIRMTTADETISASTLPKHLKSFLLGS